MSAKNIHDVVEYIFNFTIPVGRPLDDVTRLTLGALRDYFAHTVMTLPSNEAERAVMIKLFDHVFKDVPAFSRRK